MSSSIRQSNLFGAEDYKKIYKAFSFIDYTAYDFDTLKQALLNYIQTYYSENFNDYIESSEFIAIVELLAYLGTSLAFRADLNTKENFIDTAERRESIIRLAQMVNYVPRRNVAASGLFKISSVQTNEPLIDANGINIGNTYVFWNDPNNENWFDQFIQICNASFNNLNPFGRPSKNGIIGSIPTDLYQLNNIVNQTITYPIYITINGQQYPVDVCNPDFITNQTIFERPPNPANSFNFIYRNDSLGVASVNTGFFLYFKQGALEKVDTSFDFPVPNRLYPVSKADINQDDVYVQETDEDGNVIAQWKQVPQLAGENIIYNSIQFSERNIFDVISGANDSISIRFADGNFGNVPTGLFRTWVRTSANQDLVIRPDSAQGLQIAIPYIGKNNQKYTLQVVFNLEQTVGNASVSETNEQIKLRAPEVFSTQSRMVNGSDYNILPLIYGNQILKIQSTNRTYSGQSRFIDINDPTGFHKDLIIFGQDGALYRDNTNVRETVKKTTQTDTEYAVLNTIQEVLRKPEITKFFYDEYLPQFENKVRVNKGIDDNGHSILEFLPTNSDNNLLWITSPSKLSNTTGFFALSKDIATAITLKNTFIYDNNSSAVYNPYGYITPGSVLLFSSTSKPTDTPYTAASVSSVFQYGSPTSISSEPYSTVGPVELEKNIQNEVAVYKVYPAFRNTLNKVEAKEVYDTIVKGSSFWLYYDLIKDKWGVATSTIDNIDPLNIPFLYPDPEAGKITSLWNNINGGLLYVNIVKENNNVDINYNTVARGRNYVFESYRDVRFYWTPGEVVIDNATGLAYQDTIDIMPFVNTNSTIDNNAPMILDPAKAYLKDPVVFNITGVFTQEDGWQDDSKVIVSLLDVNNDGISDSPTGFSDIVSTNDRIVFETYTNSITGYSGTRPWISKWGTVFKDHTGDLYVYFPVKDGKLYGSPFLSSTNNLTPAAQIIAPTGTEIRLYLSDADLIFINKLGQLSFNGTVSPPTFTIANQLTAFYNGTPGDFTWLDESIRVLNTPNDRYNIISSYFTNKSYLIYTESKPGSGKYYNFAFNTTLDSKYPFRLTVNEVIDTLHFDKNGKTFTQDINIQTSKIPFYFKWSHYSPIDQRIDPAPTNIVDMIVITNSYYTSIENWKKNNGSIQTMPIKPSTEELRVQFQNLDAYKMISDSVIWNSGEFNVLFGPQAAPELQAIFSVVKNKSSIKTDDEVKTQVVSIIDQFFNIANWDFGENFYASELTAYIHRQLPNTISAVVINPINSKYGNLSEIIAKSNQIFISTATVNNIQIVSSIPTHI